MNSIKFLSILSFTLLTFVSLSLTLCINAAVENKKGPESESAVVWATSVHDRMIDEAFPNEERACRIQMKAGSIFADTFQFQGGGYAHMHAMRTEEQTPQEAEKKMWDHIRSSYSEVREHMRKYNSDRRRADRKARACFKRGFALHSVMDSTSPSHSGFKVWDPCDVLSAVFDHGNVRENIEDLLGIGLGVPHSHEDMSALEAHEHLKNDTIAMMRKVDAALLEKDQSFVLKKKIK